MKVLIIDDNKDITEMIFDYLVDIGIDCKTVNNGRDGLHTLKNESFDVIFMDLAMPEFSGFDILNNLKKEGLLESKNIVVITASSVSESDVNKIISAGAKEVLKKPLSVGDFDSVLNKFK